jgi:hypothetical protein
LRRPTRQFTVEVRSSNRRSSLKPTSIWGDIDLKALAREAEAEIPSDRRPVPPPVHPVGEVVLNETVAPAPTPPADDNQAALQNPAGPGVSSVAIANETDVALPVQVAVVSEEPTAQVARPRKTKSRRRPAQTLEAVPAVEAVDQTDVDWLLAENQKLKLLLRQKLMQDNALLRDMLKRN